MGGKRLVEDGLPLSASASASLASAVRAVTDGAFAARVVGFIGELVAIDSWMVLAYHADRRPVLLLDGLGNAHRRNSARQYVRSAYLLDPFYHRALAAERPELLRFADIARHNGQLADYVRSYYNRSGVSDEVNYLMPMPGGDVIAICIERASSSPGFTMGELTTLGRAMPLIMALTETWHAACWTVQARASTNGHSDNVDTVHRMLDQRLGQFLHDRVTRRESEVVRCLLRGLNAQQISAALDISVETVRVHRRNVYRKVEVSSLSELFARALAYMTAARA